MITLEQKQNSSDFIQTLIEKSWDDSNFKNELVKNPTKTIANLLGKNDNSFPQDKSLVIEDQTDNSLIYFNIPRKYDNELTLEELELVSGGDSGKESCNGLNPFKWLGTGIHEAVDWVASFL